MFPNASRVKLALVITFVMASGVGSWLLSESTNRSGSIASAHGSASTRESIIERGKYLVTIGGCNDCHTPMKMGSNGPEPDMSRMLSGHPSHLKMPPAPKLGDGRWLWTGAATNTAFHGPWGTSYAMNLTPENISGIGIWTEEMFVRALRTGKHWGSGRPIMPPMPWPNYGQMTDDDLKSIYSYLRTIPPVKNEVPDWQAP